MIVMFPETNMDELRRSMNVKIAQAVRSEKNVASVQVVTELQG